jgi:hypothetical protein
MHYFQIFNATQQKWEKKGQKQNSVQFRCINYLATGLKKTQGVLKAASGVI